MPKPKKKRRWVLGIGYTCWNMAGSEISLWNKWGSFGPSAFEKLKQPKALKIGTKVRLILEKV